MNILFLTLCLFLLILYTYKTLKNLEHENIVLGIKKYNQFSESKIDTKKYNVDDLIFIREEGKILEYGGDFIYTILYKYFNKPVINGTYFNKYSFYGRSPFTSFYNLNFNRKNLITWSGKSERVKGDKNAIINLLSQKPENKNDIWTPFAIVNLNKNLLNKIINKEFKKINERKYFLAYVASNCQNNREKMFRKILDKRQDAHALGKCSNNFKADIPREDYLKSYKMFEKYRFVLSMENKQVKGYLTEKIINVFISGAIPIFWGCSDSVKKLFNPESYIDIDDFSSYEECVDYICELDKNPEKLQEIQNKSIFKDGEVNEMFKWYEKDNKFVEKIVQKMK